MVLGFFAVMQAALNRKFAQSTDLPFAVLVNAGFLVVAGILFFLISRIAPDVLPVMFRKRDASYPIFWWVFLPGLFGFSLVAGLPWAISRLGATQVFIALISAQLVTSIIWDYLMEGIQISFSRLTAVLLIISAAFLNRQ